MIYYEYVLNDLSDRDILYTVKYKFLMRSTQTYDFCQIQNNLGTIQQTIIIAFCHYTVSEH